MTTAELRANVLSLPTEERAALAHDLIASLDAEAADPLSFAKLSSAPGVFRRWR